MPVVGRDLPCDDVLCPQPCIRLRKKRPKLLALLECYDVTALHDDANAREGPLPKKAHEHPKKARMTTVCGGKNREFLHPVESEKKGS